MPVLLSPYAYSTYQYGKAENRLVRIYRDSPRHEIHDVNVSTCLRGDFSAAHLSGDQYDVLPTDTQQQTAYAYAKEKGLASIEDHGLALARHCAIVPVQAARIEIDEFAWQRVVVDGDGEWVVGALKDLLILKSTGSEFAGSLTDPYAVLEPTHDRVMATSLVAQWRFTTTDLVWNQVYVGVESQPVKQFAVVQSRALQHAA